MLEKLKRKNPEAYQREDELIFNCPFCVPKDYGMHYYWNTQKEIGHCFKCGSVMDRIDFLKHIFGEKYLTELDKLIASVPDFDYMVFARKVPKQITKKPYKLPKSCVPLINVEGMVGKLAVKFLESRGVSRRDFYLCPNDEKLWAKMIFPIMLGGEIVFYMGRKFIKFAPGLSMSVPENVEGHYQKGDVLYGIDYVDFTKPVVIVEGIFDSLTTPNSVALLGKTMSISQYKLFMAQEPIDAVVMLDGDAHKEAFVIASRLRIGLKSVRVAALPYSKDPNDCRDEISKYIEGAKDNLDIPLDFSA